VVWAYAPHDAPLLEALGADAAVFEYKDEIASFPAYARGRRAGALRRLEAEMLGRCDLVFAPTEALARRKRGMHPRVRVARFGVDLDHFAEARRAGTPIPEDVARLPRPIAGYVGALDRYKLDFALLRAAAEASPGVTFVLVGPAGVTDGTSAAELPRLPNVVHLGPRPYADLPAYLGAFDVCLVPHRVDGYSETNLPFKVLEYLAAGRPVVATDMPALRELGAAVRRASGPRAFVEAIHRCLAEGDPPAPDPGALWSWEARARWMLDALEEVAGPARSGGGGP
jgi:glycosyltransferase involved in cell wall biosynthesis